MIFIAVVAFAACMLCYDIGRQHGERATMAAIRETIPNLGMYIQSVGCDHPAGTRWIARTMTATMSPAMYVGLHANSRQTTRASREEG